MTKLICTSCGDVYKTRQWKPAMDEARCDCGGSRVAPSRILRRTDPVPKPNTSSVGRQLKPHKGLKRTRRKESKAERAARDNFNDKVKSRVCWFRWHRPCETCGGVGRWTEGTVGPQTVGLEPRGRTHLCPTCGGDGKHHCEGHKDAHHLVPKDFFRKRFQAVLAEDQFVAILFNPKIGAPLCGKAHGRIESGADRIYWEDLTDEAIEYVFSLPDFVALRLEEECPKRPAAEPKAHVHV